MWNASEIRIVSVLLVSGDHSTYSFVTQFNYARRAKRGSDDHNAPFTGLYSALSRLFGCVRCFAERTAQGRHLLGNRSLSDREPLSSTNPETQRPSGKWSHPNFCLVSVRELCTRLLDASIPSGGSRGI